jgi:hypothetical protein
LSIPFLKKKYYIYMANELNALLNPDNIPGAVSTGYQRQNNNIFAIQTGLDTLNPIENNTSIIIEVGGIIELNGIMFKVLTTTTLNKTGDNRPFYVAVTDNGDGTASLSIVTTRGTWNNSKQGYYLPNGSRTTNKNLKNTTTTGGVLTYSKTTKGKEIISLAEGRYRAVLVSGKGGGNGSGRNGGVANTTNTAEIVFKHNGESQLQISVGGNGFNGGTGGAGFNGGPPAGGGGSGAGEETKIVGICTTNRVPAGNSANGRREGFPGSARNASSNGNGGGYGFGGGGDGGDPGTELFGGGGGSGGWGGPSGSNYSGNGGSSNYGSTGGNGGNGSDVPAFHAPTGGGGGAGGAPGWQRPDGDAKAGSVNIYRL